MKKLFLKRSVMSFCFLREYTCECVCVYARMYMCVGVETKNIFLFYELPYAFSYVYIFVLLCLCMYVSMSMCMCVCVSPRVCIQYNIIIDSWIFLKSYQYDKNVWWEREEKNASRKSFFPSPMLFTCFWIVLAFHW